MIQRKLTHRILTEATGECRVTLIEYVPEVADGETQKIHTVGAALFLPVETKRHEKNGNARKVQAEQN